MLVCKYKFDNSIYDNLIPVFNDGYEGYTITDEIDENDSNILYISENLCKKYEINEMFFCGLIVAESGWNIAPNHRKTHNYISLMVKGKLLKYSSTKEGLEVAAKKLHENYLTPGGKFYGGKTIAGVQKRFCPASTTWDDLEKVVKKGIDKLFLDPEDMPSGRAER